MKRRLDLEAASAMWAEGASVEEIAVAIGTTRSGMAGFIYRNRDRFARRIGSYTPEDRETKLVAGLNLIAAGRSRDEAAVAIDVEPAIFKYWLDKNMDRTRVAEQLAAEPVPVAPATAAARPAKSVATPPSAARPTPAADPGDTPDLNFVPAKADAFRPLPGSVPRELAVAIGCRWPIHLDGDPLRENTTLVCDEPKAHGKTPYCCSHLAMSTGRGTPSERIAHETLRRVA